MIAIRGFRELDEPGAVAGSELTEGSLPPLVAAFASAGEAFEGSKSSTN
jgi:hypothetical protein